MTSWTNTSRHTTSYSNGTKHSTSFTNQVPSSSSFSAGLYRGFGAFNYAGTEPSGQKSPTYTNLVKH